MQLCPEVSEYVEELVSVLVATRNIESFRVTNLTCRGLLQKALDEAVSALVVRREQFHDEGTLARLIRNRSSRKEDL